MMRTVENGVAQVEQFVNPIDWVPFVASFSGMVRILAGAVQVAAGAAFALLRVFYIILTGKGWYEQAIEQGLIYSIHGIGNMVRGSIAMLPVVNIVLFVYDYQIGRMNYEQEYVRKGVYPIMTAHQYG